MKKVISLNKRMHLIKIIVFLMLTFSLYSLIGCPRKYHSLYFQDNDKERTTFKNKYNSDNEIEIFGNSSFFGVNQYRISLDISVKTKRMNDSIVINSENSTSYFNGNEMINQGISNWKVENVNHFRINYECNVNSNDLKIGTNGKYEPAEIMIILSNTIKINDESIAIDTIFAKEYQTQYL